MRYFAALASTLCIFSIYARDVKVPADIEFTPWLTGSLIAPPGTTIEKGKFNINSYLYGIVNTGEYNNHWHAHSTGNFYTISPQFFSLFGITEWMDFQTAPQIIYNITKNQSSCHFGDLPVGFNFQLLSDEYSTWFPGIKFSIGEILPTGKYQKLNPKKLETDASGEGSFTTYLGLVFFQIYELKERHILSTTGSFEYNIAAPVHVKGYNTYGGGRGTRGKVYPGNSYTAIFSFEYTFNQRWVFTMDNIYTHINKIRFSGKSGHSSSGEKASLIAPSSEQISFAPALEYNFDVHFGIVAGVWFSAWGRNCDRFRNGVVNFEYNY